MDPIKVTGSCLCARVQYELTGPFPGFRYCHCERCRKLTGSAHSSNILIPKERLRWTAGEKETQLFIHPEAENYARHFCRTCGGPVPKLTRDGRLWVVPAGTLDEDPGVRPSANIFWRLHAPWYVDVSTLLKYDERPPAK